jgi:hypothetical protein
MNLSAWTPPGSSAAIPPFCSPTLASRLISETPAPALAPDPDPDPAFTSASVRFCHVWACVCMPVVAAPDSAGSYFVHFAVRPDGSPSDAPPVVAVSVNMIVHPPGMPNLNSTYLPPDLPTEVVTAGVWVTPSAGARGTAAGCSSSSSSPLSAQDQRCTATPQPRRLQVLVVHDTSWWDGMVRRPPGCSVPRCAGLGWAGPGWAGPGYVIMSGLS